MTEHDQKIEPADSPAGPAVRWAIAALLLMVLAAVYLVFKSFSGQAPTAAVSEQAVPTTMFKDITAEAGIRFVHTNGAYGEKLLPETMGGGCAFFDFDGDGNQDIVFVNSSWRAGSPLPQSDGMRGSAVILYRNDGHGHFDDVTASSGLDAKFYGMGVAIGDYDNDGKTDLFVTGVRENHLFHNLGSGQFEDVTKVAGLTTGSNDWSTSSAFFDLDNDGDLDLFVCKYVQWSPEIDKEVDYKLPGIGRAYGPPLKYQGSFCALYRNEGGGRFTDISASSGIQISNKSTGLPLGKALGVAPVDLDGDGWMDLVVANDTVQNFVFHNEHNGTFKEIGELSGAAFDSFGKVRGAMGIDAARFQEDNSLGISIGNFANEMTAVYVSQRDPLTFSDDAMNQGVGAVSRPYLTFGVFFFDYDLDGWLDLLSVNGHIEDQIAVVQPSQTYRQPAQLFWNARGKGGAKGFVPVSPAKCGNDLLKPIVGRGSAYADVDGDGDLDVLLAQINGPPVLLRNEQRLKHHWIRLKLVGARCNRDAIGASINARFGSQTIWRQVMPTRGYLSQSELPVTIGLGTRDHVDEVQVIWPGGATQKVGSVKIDGLTTVVQSP